MVDLVLEPGFAWETDAEDKTVYPDLQEKVGEYTGQTLYSYTGAYWFSTPEAAANAYRRMNDGEGV